MDWDKANTLFFISLIRDRPVVWDIGLQVDHKDKKKSHNAVDEMVKQMGRYFSKRRKKWFAFNENMNGNIPYIVSRSMG